MTLSNQIRAELLLDAEEHLRTAREKVRQAVENQDERTLLHNDLSSLIGGLQRVTGTYARLAFIDVRKTGSREE